MDTHLDGIESGQRSETAAWRKIVVQYQEPSTWRARWQTANTLGPLAFIWYLMYCSLEVSWWLTVPLAVFAGAFLVRVFIIFHDCGHGSYFKSGVANDFVGVVPGVRAL